MNGAGPSVKAKRVVWHMHDVSVIHIRCMEQCEWSSEVACGQMITTHCYS